MSRPESSPAPYSGAGESSSQRLFFALWPSPELQRHIFSYGQSLLAETPARRLPVENLHLTLLFLGQVSNEAQRCLEQSAAALTLPGFDLDFDRLVHRPKQRMLWLQADTTPPALQRLADALGQTAEDCGLQIDPRPFCAHITLLRKVARAPVNLPQPDFIWPVREFVLVASKTLSAGAEYRVVKKWSLKG